MNRNLFSIRIFIFLLLRSSCKNLKSYNNPLCHFSNGGWFIGVIFRFIGVILPVHWGYIADSLGLYCRFIGVILPIHWGYIAGSLGLYCRFIGVIWRNNAKYY